MDAYDDLVTEAGATVLFHTVLARVETDATGRVTAILTANKAGLMAWRAKVFVDCTGDADLTAWAGGEFHKGNADGKRPAKIRRRVHVMAKMRMPGMRVPRRRALRPGLGVL